MAAGRLAAQLWIRLVCPHWISIAINLARLWRFAKIPKGVCVHVYRVDFLMGECHIRRFMKGVGFIRYGLVCIVRTINFNFFIYIYFLYYKICAKSTKLYLIYMWKPQQLQALKKNNTNPHRKTLRHPNALETLLATRE